jgi:hypothetical protein
MRDMQRHKLLWRPSVTLHYSYMTRGHVAQRWHKPGLWALFLFKPLGHGSTTFEEAYLYSYYFTGFISNGVDIVDTGVKKTVKKISMRDRSHLSVSLRKLI